MSFTAGECGCLAEGEVGEAQGFWDEFIVSRGVSGRRSPLRSQAGCYGEPGATGSGVLRGAGCYGCYVPCGSQRWPNVSASVDQRCLLGRAQWPPWKAGGDQGQQRRLYPGYQGSSRGQRAWAAWRRMCVACCWQTGEGKIFYLLVHVTDGRNSQGWAKPNPGQTQELGTPI